VDRDFGAIMIAQRQGAIDVARAELKYGRDEALRRLAQRIVDEDESELSIMRRASEQIPSTQQAGKNLATSRAR
jgi:uncharacterized protein (DUF305 family)